MKELRLEDKNSGKGTNMTKCKKLDKTTLVRCRSARVCPERLKILHIILYSKIRTVYKPFISHTTKTEFIDFNSILLENIASRNGEFVHFKGFYSVKISRE